MTTTTTATTPNLTPTPAPAPADRVSPDPGRVIGYAERAAWQLHAAADAYRDRHEGDLVVIDTSDTDQLRRDHPGLFSDTAPADTLAAYARQADELAAMVEQYDTAHRQHITVLLHALGDLHVAMDELATRLDQRPAGGAS